MIARTVRGPALGVVVFGVLALTYVRISPSLAHQHWDSLNYAWACEARGVRAMWGNHPLGHLVGCGVFDVARGLGYAGRALPLLKIANAVVSAAVIVTFFVVLTRVLGAGRLRSAGWAALLAGAYGWWRQTGSADIYSVALLLLIVAWAATIAAFDRPSRRGALLAGLAAGVAALGHQLSGVLLLVGALVLLWPLGVRGVRRPSPALGAFLAAAALTIVVGYGLLGMLATGSASPLRIGRWIVGHGLDPAYGRFFGLDGAAQALHRAAFTLGLGNGRGARWGLALGCLALALGGALALRRLPRRERTIALSCAAQCVVGTLLIVWWEPTQVGKFWLLMLPAFFTWGEITLAGASRGLATLGPEGSRRAARALDAAPALAGAALFLSTASIMVKQHRPDLAFEQSLNAWIEHSEREDLLLDAGRFTAPLLFWGDRPGSVAIHGILRASRDDPDRFARLRELIERTARQRHAVLLPSRLDPYLADQRLAAAGVTLRQVEDFFDRYPREGPVFEYRDGAEVRQVYRLLVPAP